MFKIKKVFADLSPEMIEENFQEFKKCKISGEISKIKQNEKKTKEINSNCFLEIKIKLKGVYNFELKTSYPTGNCDTDSPYYNFNEIYRPLPKVGDTIYAIIDKENNHIIKYGKNDFEKYAEINTCEISASYNYYFFGTGIFCLVISIILIIILKKN